MVFRALMPARARTSVVRICGLAACIACAAALPAFGATSATPTGHWTFDEGSGTTAADSSAGGHPLTLQNGASWGPGVVGAHSLSLQGGGQNAASSGPVIDTTKSFTVSAWVNLARLGGYQTFVSQDGSQVSG